MFRLASGDFDNLFPISVTIMVDYRHTQYNEKLPAGSSNNNNNRSSSSRGGGGGIGIFRSAFLLIYSIAWRLRGFLDKSYLGRRIQELRLLAFETIAATGIEGCEEFELGHQIGKGGEPSDKRSGEEG